MKKIKNLLSLMIGGVFFPLMTFMMFAINSEKIIVVGLFAGSFFMDVEWMIGITALLFGYMALRSYFLFQRFCLGGIGGFNGEIV